MTYYLRYIRTVRTALFAVVASALCLLGGAAYAQSPSAQALSADTVKALQEALNKQGIAVKTDGILDDDTKAAIGKYQSQHHLPVTGEPDKATLDKLGVASTKSGGTPAAPTAPGKEQAGPGQGMMMGPGHGMMGGGQGMTGGGQPMPPSTPKQ